MATEKHSINVNPLIGVGNPRQTLSNAKGVTWFLTLTAPTLAEGGSNDDANHGLSIILECAALAVGHAAQAIPGRGGAPWLRLTITAP